ncbi:MAG TPA: MCE family protein [Mycobacteriales bacterium]|nr:MCE family protein [Mycobacteriales bacterium]
MAPPLVKGRALARRRLAGIAFIVVVGMLVQLAVWMYQKKFVDVVEVSLHTDRIGNQLSVHADVKMRGLLVGEVRKIRSAGDAATLELALDPDKAKLVPKDASAQLLPKTLFGEKQVVLVAPDATSGGHVEDGDVISQDRSSTALETEEALNNLLPLLKALRPQELSTFLSELSTAVRDRGDQLGGSAARTAAYLNRLNPQLPAVGADLQGLADLADNLARTSPDLLRELDNLSASSRSLVDERAALDAFLTSTSDFAATTRDFVTDNEARLVALSRDSVAPLKLFAAYSDTYPCLLDRLAFAETEGERVFGGAQPGLHITIEATQDRGGYHPGEEPKYREDFNAHCFGLGKKAIRPFPEYINPRDGYRDGQPPADPNQGPGGCCDATAAWQPQVMSSPRSDVVRQRSFPGGTTVLEALLLAPVTGIG